MEGTNHTVFFLLSILTRLSVNSPSKKQTHKSPSSGSKDLSIISKSPGSIPSSFIERPFTLPIKLEAGFFISSLLRS
nr:MAG TPA: hypothetical protein [Caudoviricetes sp.]